MLKDPTINNYLSWAQKGKSSAFSSLLAGRLWKIFHTFLSSADLFQNQLFRKILSGIPSECQTDWIQIRPDVLSGLIWVQSVCKSYQQTTLGGKELNNKKGKHLHLSKTQISL